MSYHKRKPNTEWKKSKTKKWYKAVCKAAKKRRGTHNRFSIKHSITMKKLWKTEKYRNKVVKRMSKGVQASWENGRKDSISTKEKCKAHSKKMKKKWQDPKFKKRMLKGLLACRKTKEWKEQNSKMMKKRWADPIYHAKMCKIRKTQSKGNQMRTPNASFYRTKYKGIHGNFWMRSSWEVCFALWLDHCGIKWEYENKKFLLSKGHYYTPDFYLLDQDEYVELKGWMTKKDEKKIAKFNKKYPNVKLYVFGAKHLGKVLEFKKKIA